MTINPEIKVQNLNPFIISQKNVILNTFRLSDYKEIDIDASKEYLSFYFQYKGKHYILSQYLGNIVECESDGEYLIPHKVYFELKDGTFDYITIEYVNTQTKFIYKKSTVVINNGKADIEPYDLKNSTVDKKEIINFLGSLKTNTALQYIKYFFDVLVCQNNAKMIFFDKDYFSHTYNILNDQYFSFDDDIETIETRIKEIQTSVLNAKNDVQKLYVTKMFVEFKTSYIEAIKHVILLVLYKNQWFIIDSNGGIADYAIDSQNLNFCNLLKVLSDLNIHWCINLSFQQKGECCDTCASAMAYFLSEYYKENGGLVFEDKIKQNIQLTPYKNIDFSKLYCFIEKNQISKKLLNIIYQIL